MTIQTPILSSKLREGRKDHAEWVLLVWDLIALFLKFEFELVDRLLEEKLAPQCERYPKSKAWYFYLKARLALEYGDTSLLEINENKLRTQIEGSTTKSHDELYMLASILFVKGDNTESKQIIKNAYRVAKNKQGAEHTIIKCMYLYAEVLNRTGDARRAKIMGDMVFSRYKDTMGHRLEIPLRFALARSSFALKEMAEAKSHLLEVSKIMLLEEMPYYRVLLSHHWAEYFLLSGKPNMADLALSMIPDVIYKNSNVLSKSVDTLLQRLETKEITLDLVRKMLLVPGMIPLDLGNQLILTRMLKLFLSQPGKEFDKEDLIKYVWDDEYNPVIHDNKIYFMINRIRKFIEPDPKKPTRIIKGFKGYCWNPKNPCRVIDR